MLIVAVALVAVPVGAFVVADSQRHMPLPVTAAMHRHYFEVGKRQCSATIKKAEADAPSGQLIAVQVAIDTTGYPEDFRDDVGAGCQAASG